MKKYYVSFLLVLLSSVYLRSQNRNNDDEVIKIDSRMSQYNCMPNEVLVKFKSGYEAQMRKSSGNTFISGVNSVDIVLAGYDIEETEQVLPNDNPKRILRSAKTYSGGELKETNLDQLYRLKVSASSVKNNLQLIEELKALPEVEYAEPNYIVSILGEPTEEPMYALQWGISAVNLPSLWTKSVFPGSSRKIIAILDTGVDIGHPDLADNIWINSAEVNGNDHYDDDGNGFEDDIQGWDFVNNSPVVRDNNSHGTHCAGIAAAVGSNGIGITGANPNALIMPLTVLQSNGTGDIATIIKAIHYAAQNGADIISMSFGSYAHSIALEQALGQAYQSCVLVAAAGNDGVSLQPGCAPYPPSAQMFPAAFSFVLGVQATVQGGGLASFSNYDCDGPVFSSFPEEQLYNYELKAPGQNIMSTIPGGSYRSYNGTSMATPLVAGGIAALLERKEFASQEMLWATLIQSADENIDFDAAYGYTPQPELNIIAVEINDISLGDGDMRPDAGELIEIYPTLKNTGGEVEDIYFKVEFAGFEEQTTATILNESAEFGYTLAPYSKMKAQNPVQIQIGQDVADGQQISMVVTAWHGDHQSEVSQVIALNVENGVELSGMLTHTDTLYPDVHYIVTDNFAIPAGVTLVIKPGTVIKMKDNVVLSSAGKIYAVGTPDSIITFTKTDLGIKGGKIYFGNYDTLEYCKMEYNIMNKNNIVGNSVRYFSNCIISDMYYGSTYAEYTAAIFNGFTNFKHSNFLNNSNLYVATISSPCNGNNFIKNVYDNPGTYGQYAFLKAESFPMSSNSNIFSNSALNKDEAFSFSSTSALPVVYSVDNPPYLGSSQETIARKGIFDFYTPNSGVFGAIDLSNMATRPYAEAHGIVWKVVVNDYDAQDQFDILPPLGVGRHKFDVYFNRPMNKNVAPLLAMGIRPPYTQNAIAEDGSWNEEGDIYTVFYTVKAANVTDGLNRIYVANARDNENFEIPCEDQRFNVIIQSAGSLSSGFSATPGMGRVSLEWEAPEEYFDDLLGYTMYRYTYDADTEVYSDTVQINQLLLTNTEFVDFDVYPGKIYNYMYKVMRTDLTENDYSRSVSAIPYTAEKGDANGSLTIDVADIVATVNYIIGNNPQPFIYEAADVNSDTYVNVLDIVGIVNLILNPEDYMNSYNLQSTAFYSVENGILYVESPGNLGGVQFLIRADRNSADIRPLEAIGHFEKASQWLNDSTYLFLAYAMSGQEIAAGRKAILQLSDATLLDIILANPNGAPVILSNAPTDIDEVKAAEKVSVLKLYPNPFNSSLKIALNLENPDNQKVDIVFVDVMGRVIEQATSIVAGGTYEVEWTPKSKLIPGIYFCQLRINNRIVKTEKVICKE